MFRWRGRSCPSLRSTGGGWTPMTRGRFCRWTRPSSSSPPGSPTKHWERCAHTSDLFSLYEQPTSAFPILRRIVRGYRCLTDFFLLFFTAHRGLVFYTISNSVIYRPSDHTVGRLRAEIRTQAGRFRSQGL